MPHRSVVLRAHILAPMLASWQHFIKSTETAYWLSNHVAYYDFCVRAPSTAWQAARPVWESMRILTLQDLC